MTLISPMHTSFVAQRRNRGQGRVENSQGPFPLELEARATRTAVARSSGYLWTRHEQVAGAG